MGLQKTFAGGLVGLILTIMSYMVCDALIVPGVSEILDMMAVLIPMAFGLGTVLYVILGAFRTSD